MEEQKYKRTIGQKLFPIFLLLIVLSIPTFFLIRNYVNKVYYMEILNVNNDNLFTEIKISVTNKKELYIYKSDFANMKDNTPKEIFALKSLKEDVKGITISENSNTTISIFISDSYKNANIYYKGKKLEFGKKIKFINK